MPAFRNIEPEGLELKTEEQVRKSGFSEWVSVHSFQVYKRGNEYMIFDRQVKRFVDHYTIQDENSPRTP